MLLECDWVVCIFAAWFDLPGQMCAGCTCAVVLSGLMTGLSCQMMKDVSGARENISGALGTSCRHHTQVTLTYNIKTHSNHPLEMKCQTAMGEGGDTCQDEEQLSAFI